MDNISGKTVAITGAARGIGFATAKALLDRRARVVIGDRDVALQESAVAGLGKHGQVSGYPLDVTDRESFATFLDKARTDGGGHIDVLINNAGVMPIGPFLEQSEQSIRSSIEVNLYGVLTGCQLALPEMVARRSGHIINIASLSGLIPVPGQVVYVGAKFGVVGLSAALADEVAPQGVDVSVVMPPFTNTELISGTKSGGAIKPVEPEEIAAAIVKTLDKPKTHVSVPTPLRFTAQAASDARSARSSLAEQAAGPRSACSWTSIPRRGRATSSGRRPRWALSSPTRKANGDQAFRRKRVGRPGRRVCFDQARRLLRRRLSPTPRQPRRSGHRECGGRSAGTVAVASDATQNHVSTRRGLTWSHGGHRRAGSCLRPRRAEYGPG